MRCDQYIGLNEWAKQQVLGTQKVREVGCTYMPGGTMLPFDRVVDRPIATTEVIGQIEGAWDDVVADLHRYSLPDGRVYEEYVQATPWSGGPCYFVALRDAKGLPVPQSLWTGPEIDVI